jgi:hypothetical protein
MKKIIILAVCAFGIQMAAKAQTAMPVITATPAVESAKDEAAASAVAAPAQAVEKKQCAGAAKSCSGTAATKSCCKAKTTAAAAPAAKSCCKDKAAASAGCKGHEASAGGEKKSCAKPCCKKSEN